jgi:hypothetical protein
MTRETDTLDGYACSSWYLWRYASPHDSEHAWNPEAIKYWEPLDVYCGGDHAVAHLLYIRFWCKFFANEGKLPFREPIVKLLYNGYINAPDGKKMSKSKGNVIDPLDVINDGYGMLEDWIHPGIITLSQRFRDPWNLNILEKLSLGRFSNKHYGVALEAAYHFPNERFWVDGKIGVLDLCDTHGMVLVPNATYDFQFYWNIAANYYWPAIQTQFLLRAERFLIGDMGVKYEMIRHFRRCSVGFYAMKGFSKAAHVNGGFRFQIALPPFRQKRYGYIPRLRTSGQMGISYNANNERYYYKEFRTEASDNILSKFYFNPYYIDGMIAR